MISRQTVKYSLRNLNKQKARSFFTILSIFLGIATIFIFVSFGLGLYGYIEDLTESSSADKLIIQPKGGTLQMFSSNVEFDDEDLEAVQGVSGVYGATGSYFKTVEVKAQEKRLYTLLISYDPKNPLIMDTSNIEVERGRQVRSGGKEVVLGHNYGVDNKIFPKAIRLNQNIEINGENIKVVGFFEEVGNPQDDSQAYMSNDYMEELYSDENLTYLWMIAQVDLDNIETVKERIERELRDARNLEKGKEDFFVQSFDDLIDGFSNTLDVIILFIVFIALISVAVSAINTANTMITSVLERTKEIGIIKSIGARNSDVFGIFLFESGFLGFMGGVAGILLGWFLSYLGGLLLGFYGYSFLQPSFPAWLFVSCVIFATVTGAVSGVWPAVNASQVNPVDALRYE